jgi:uncharacterized protein
MVISSLQIFPQGKDGSPLKRSIDPALLSWENNPERLVLLVRGARQVGKTYSVRNLESTFRHILEINFEERTEAKSFFEGDLLVQDICEKLTAFFGVPLIPGETLLFFDEIQTCPNCLRALRFFHERMPDLHVVAAGSLLEFVLAEIPAFGVGRIQSLFMYPLSFGEFMGAIDSQALWDYARNRKPAEPLDAPIHQKLVDKMRTYMLVGGMPAAVDSYVRKRDLRACQDLIGALLTTFFDDFSKYANRIDPLVLRDTLRSVGSQAGGKFKYASVGADIPGRTAKSALDLLCRAGLAYRVYHTAARGIPLGAHKDHKRLKVIPFDIGIHQRMLGLSLPEIIIADPAKMVHRGHLAEIFAGLQCIMESSPLLEPELFCWHREARDADAEVDYVFQQSDRIVPVEIKSGLRGSMQSMRLFLKERNLPVGIRLSAENASRYKDILSLPLYTAGRLVSDDGITA